MAESTIAAPRPMRMSLATGVRGFVAGAAAEAGGQHSLLLAVIAGGFIVVGSIAAPIVAALMQQRRRAATDITDQQAELLNHVIDHLSTELAAKAAQLAATEAEVRRLKRRRRA